MTVGQLIEQLLHFPGRFEVATDLDTVPDRWLFIPYHDEGVLEIRLRGGRP